MIDSLKYGSKLSSSELLRRMSVIFSHQSCAMEGNSLGIEDSEKNSRRMNKDHNLDDLLEPEEIQLPDARSLSDKSENKVIKIRNHLLATYYLNNKLHNLEREVNIDEIKRVHYILLKDTPQEKISVWAISKKQEGFERVNASTRLSLDCLSEVPALMERFLQFRDDRIKNGSIHPIMIACRLLEAFLHIHPFYEGNGRVGRSIMALYLIRNGDPPVVLQKLDRKEEYVNSLIETQAEKDYSRLYDMVIEIYITLM
ncbi:4914_t:CDS:2 [Ambispora leptoticha]|uniref:4914_t:CDS:1 n=1 Tax=Ambispora leptoticha TaxID=144679 RepID=A0A9N8ZQM3_9GLOM|nr:4914_t:CDS:2 [Ambispora leptoticha]